MKLVRRCSGCSGEGFAFANWLIFIKPSKFIHFRRQSGYETNTRRYTNAVAVSVVAASIQLFVLCFYCAFPVVFVVVVIIIVIAGYCLLFCWQQRWRWNNWIHMHQWLARPVKTPRSQGDTGGWRKLTSNSSSNELKTKTPTTCRAEMKTLTNSPPLHGQKYTHMPGYAKQCGCVYWRWCEGECVWVSVYFVWWLI